MKEQKESIGSILEQSKKSRGIYKYISLFKNKKFIIIFMNINLRNFTDTHLTLHL